LRFMEEGRRGKPKTVFLVCILILMISISSTATFSRIALSPLSTASAVPSPIFGMTLIVPQGDAVKLAWATLLQRNLRQLGINCTIVSMNMSEISSRVLAPNSSVIGRNYSAGGYDAIAWGYQLPISPDPYLFYDSGQIAPKGMNYYLWNDSTNDVLCSLIRSETNATKRLQLEQTWQTYAMDWLPSTAVFYENASVILNSSLDLEPFELLTYPIWPAVERWSGNWSVLGSTIVLAQAMNASNLIPLFSNSYFDSAVMNPIYGPAGYGLFQLSDIGGTKSYVPCIAKNWTVSSDYRNWTINLKNSVSFQDGVQLTGADVVFTLRSYMTPELDSPLYPLFADIFGSNSSVSLGANNLNVTIHLAKSYAYITDLLSVPILPEHILAYIPYSDWRTSPLNTGMPSNVKLLNGTEVHLTGPVGAGPYSYVDFNATTHTYHLEKFSSYFNRTELESNGLFHVQDYYVKIVATGYNVTAQFYHGLVDVIDPEYHLDLLGSYFKSYVPLGKVANISSLSVQELGFNMRHPVLGTGMDTPVGIANSSNAAEAARHVRKAIAYAIPRQSIITDLLAGHGLPSRTSVFCPLNEGYNNSISFYEYNLTKAENELRLAGYEPASIIPSFFESYGASILAVTIAAIAVIALFGLWKTKRIFKSQKPAMK
jgi:ABC-type transport system substrate-binding protein